VRIEVLQDVVWSHGGHGYDRESTAVVVLLFPKPMSRLRCRMFEVVSVSPPFLQFRVYAVDYGSDE